MFKNSVKSFQAPSRNGKRDTFILLGCTIFILAMSLMSCDLTEEEPLTGDVIGLAEPVDQWNRPISDKSGITVGLDSAAYTDQTNENGRYKLQGVEAGTYTITFQKDGYGINKIPFYQFIGGGNDFVDDGLPTRIGKIPEYTVAIDSIYIQDSFGGKIIALSGTFSASAPQGGVATSITFVSRNPEVSADNPSSYMQASASQSFPGVTSTGAAFPLSDFAAGDTLYFISYPSAGSALFYLDPSAQTNNMVYTSLGSPTDVRSFIIPDTVTASHTVNESKVNGLTLSFYRMDKTTREVIPLPANITREQLVQVQKQIRDYVSQIKMQIPE